MAQKYSFRVTRNIVKAQVNKRPERRVRRWENSLGATLIGVILIFFSIGAIMATFRVAVA